MTSIFLEILFFMTSMWFFHVTFSSMITPRKSTVFSFNFDVIESNCRRMGQNCHQFATLWNKTCLVLVKFSESLGVIHLWRPNLTKLTKFVTPYPLHPQKWTIELLLKNNRFRKNVAIFETPFSHPPSMWTS